MIDARCPGCGAHGEGLWVGRGMRNPWPFELRLYACSDPECSTLTVARMVVPLRQLKAVVEGGAAPSDALPELPKSARELAELLVAVRRWPSCACGAQLGGRAQRGEEDLACPRCGTALQVTNVGMWD